MSGPSIILAPPAADLLEALLSHGCEVETAEDGYRVVELAPRVHPAVLIASVGLPGPEPPELVRRVKAVAPDCRAIILGARRREDAAALLRAGCDAALSADPDPRYLLWTLGRVLVGGVVLSPELARGLVETLSESVHREQEWARTLADRTKQAEVLAQAKADFLGNVSHELRTPLTIIKGVASLLRRMDAPEDQAELLEQAEHAADRLTAMVDDLLTMAEVEGGTLTLDIAPCDLAPLLLEEVTAAAGRHPNVSIGPHVPDSVPAEADAPRIREVVRHLLDNACRYSKAGETISIRARVADEGVTISVTDRGEGVDRGQVSAAFGQPFAPGEDPLTKERAGLGIGLNLARNIVALHGGILWAEPLPGGGSRVSFTLPPPVSGEAAATEGDPATAHGGEPDGAEAEAKASS